MMNELHEKLIKLANEDENDANETKSGIISSNTTVQMRRAPVSTYKKIYSTIEFISAELFHSLTDLLSPKVPVWLAQRLAWSYVFEFGREEVCEAFQINRDEIMIDKERIVEYAKANRRRIVNEWMQRYDWELTKSYSSNLQAYSECGIKNKRRTMEDKTCVISSSILGCGGASLFALFDGHCGAECAEFVSKHLPVELASMYLNSSSQQISFQECFSTVNQRFNKMASSQGIKSGSTACVALLDIQRRVLHVAWCGDSQLCLVERVVEQKAACDGEWRVSFVSEPHKPSREDEKRRILNAGGTVSFVGDAWRLNDSLAVSRSFGDLAYQDNNVLTSQPDQTSLLLDQTHSYFIIGCDGFFEHVSLDDELFQRIDQFIAENNNQHSGVAEWLCGLARDNGSSDNISVIFVPLDSINYSS